MMGRVFGWVAAGGLVIAACGGASQEEPTVSGAAVVGSVGEQKSAPADVAEVARSTTFAALTDRASLSLLEKEGFALGRIVAGSAAQTTAELGRLPAFGSIFATLKEDVAETARANPPARVTSIDGFRLFDVRHFDSKEMTFELTGVFNRLDRRTAHAKAEPASPNAGCGEIRFLYRMRYTTEQGGAPMSGSLPVTFNVVHTVAADEAGSCASVARSWQPPEELSGADAAEWMIEHGALSKEMRARYTLHSIETNVQNLRLQSSVQVTMAGHVEYGMHVFRRDGDRFVPGPMENMPDVGALEADPALRAELLSYLKKPEVLRAIDEGTLKLPDRFVATKASSFSPRGMTRGANRPFQRLFDEAELDGLDLSSYSTIVSTKALLRRLDNATCVGCHQTRSIAGFHHLGEDAADAPAFLSLISGTSSHLRADLERRRAYVASVAQGKEPSEARPVPERQGTTKGFGAPCGLGDPGFADWTCGEGLTCTKLEDEEIGTCLEQKVVGAACEYGTVRSNPIPRKDAVTSWSQPGCGAAMACSKNINGFPLGTCGGTCEAMTADGTCSDFLDIDGFQNCLRFDFSFETCAERHVLATQVRGCSVDEPCRQDYVCVRTEAGPGACVPPYFVYPLRLDAYPQ